MTDSAQIRTDISPSLGFIHQPVGSHSSRSIMVDELRRLLDAVPADASYEEISRLALDENVLGKSAYSSRVNTFRRLREYYALRPEIPLYSALRFLWDKNPHEQPMLSMLCAVARDPILRATIPLVIDWSLGEHLPKQKIEELLEIEYPGRYSKIVSESMARKLLSSWTQSGHLNGRSTKIRTRAISGAASTVYALFLGYLTGLRGNALLSTVWVRILDASPGQIDQMAVEASRRGWIDYRHAGDIVDVGFDPIPGSEIVL